MSTPVLLILAGGASSRLWPLREKSLINFSGQPLLATQLTRLQVAGFERAIIIANPDNEAAIRDLTQGENKPDTLKMTVEVVVQPEPKGMGDALLKAEPVLKDLDTTPIYVTQVHDVVDDLLHEEMLKTFKRRPNESLIAGIAMDTYFPGGYLKVDDDRRITGIVEKPGAENTPSNLVNIVAHIHADAARLFEAIHAEYDRDLPSDDHYERAMDSLMAEQVYRVVSYAGRWNAIKYPWHVLDVMNAFLDRIEGQEIHTSAFIAPTATIVGNVIIEEGARVFPGAAVVGPAYIGKGTIVGNNSLVRNSMVLDKCEVGFTTEIARSYVSERCSMHACRVLDSVFAPGVNFSAGCTTANLRIDRGNVPSTVKGEKLDSGRDKLGAIIGQDAFLGVDVMTMPGVKIGERAQIGPGTNVRHDVSNGQRVYVKQELVVVEDGDA